MATITAPKAKSSFPAMETVGVNGVVSTYSASALFSAGDVVQMVKIPKDARVLELVLYSTSEADFQVGDGIDPNRYAVAAGQSAVTRLGEGLTTMNTAFAYEYSAADTIDLTVDSADAVTGIVTLNVLYLVNDLSP